MSELEIKLQSRLQRGAHRTLTGLHPVVESLLAAIVGLLLGAALMYLWGYDPWKAYWALLQGAFGGSYEWASTLARGTPLILTALTFSICVRAGMFNIGAEGQLFLGAMGAVCVVFFKAPAGLHLIIGLLFAAVAGAMWSIIPAVLKVSRGVSEVISTIMFNWIGIFLARYISRTVLVDPSHAERTLRIPITARFPILVRGSDLSYAFFLSVFVAVVLYIILYHTTVGYEVRAAGLNPTAARYGGIRNKRTMLVSFLLGGITAGLAGATVVMGMPPSYAAFGPAGFPELTNLGFDGMAVAMVGRNHPLGIIAAGIFFGGLNAGGRVMQLYGSKPVPLEMVEVVMGTIVIALSIPELTRLFPALVGAGERLVNALRRPKGAAKKEGSA